MKTTLIAVDPGYERLGLAILQKESGQREILLHSECLKTSAKIPFEERLFLLGQRLEILIKQYEPSILAIESLFFTNNQKTALRVSEVRGALLYIAKTKGLTVREFTPNEIKVAVTGYGKGTKADILFMVPKLIDVDVQNKIDDELDAIAVGLTCFAHMKITTYPQ
jgi:crossover junction endodeoxyribonuclease RuvC